MSLLSLPLVALVLLSALIFNPVFAAKGDGMREEAVSAGNSTNNSTGVSWIFPDSSSTSTFNSVDTVDAQWSSTYGNPNLRLLCKNENAGRFIQRSNVNVAPTGSQAVLMDITQHADTLICHFMLIDQLNAALSSNSPPFAIQDASNAAPHTWSSNSPTAPTTSIAPSDTAAPTSTWTPNPASSNASSSTSSASASSSSSSSTGSGLSTGAGVGIGIGVAAAVVTLAVGGLLLFLRARQRKAQPSKDTPDDRPKGMMKNRPIRVIPGVYETLGNRPVPQELDASAQSIPSDVTLARSVYDRNEVAGHSPIHLDAASRRGSETSDGSRDPGSMRRGPIEATGSPI